MRATVSPRPSLVSLWLLCAIVAFGFALRAPSIHRDFYDLHAWKNIRHFQFAESMLVSGNYFVGSANFTQPETDPVWYNRVVEAPLVDWLLVVVFRVFGVSIPAFRLTFIAVSLATVVLFFVLTRRHLGDGLAILGAALLAATPLAAYFAGHGIGEQFVPAGQLLVVAAAARALAEGASWRDHLVLALGCLFLVMAKLTTGLMLAGLCFVAVAALLALRHRGRVRREVARWKVFLAVLGVPATVVGGWLLWSYLGALHRNLLVEYPLASGGFWATLLVRWREHLGLYLLVLVPVSLCVYLVVLARHLLGRSGAGGPSAFERAVLVAFAANLIQFAVQSRPFLVHEYYALTWVVPALLLGLAMLRRLLDRSPRPVAVASLAALLVLVGYSVPVSARSLRWLNSFEQVGTEDRAALRTFFEHRKQGRGKYFVIAREPRWGYFADVFIDLCYEWPDLVGKLARTPRNLEYLGRTGISYVVYPRYAVPDEVLEGLDRDPLVDPGPDHLKLGLVHRGCDMLILKITSGVARRAPLPGTDPPARFDGWRFEGMAFRESAKTRSRGPVIRSTAEGIGTLVSPPLLAEGDALLFGLAGGPHGGNRVELALAGEVLYAVRPATEHQPVLFAIDLGRCWGHEVAVRAVDAMSWEQGSTSVGGFEQIWYEPPTVPPADGAPPRPEGDPLQSAP